MMTVEAQHLHYLATLHQMLLGNRGFLDRNLPDEHGRTQYPWVEPSHGFIEFSPLDSLALPAVGAADATVVTMPVPEGYDGIIKYIVNTFEGGGFVSGSGDILWRITADGRPVRNFSAINSRRGTTSEQWKLVAGIRIFSGQTIEYVVNHAANPALTGADTICGFTGYFYPIKGG